jgi:predicted TIM-barrel fold metal-dependent hydrolase
MPSSGRGDAPVIEIPRIISVDDHVVEPPHVWTSRLSARDREHGPRVERRPARVFEYRGGTGESRDGDGGALADYWVYEDKTFPLFKLSAAAGFPRDEVDLAMVTYDDIRPGCWQVGERLADMDLNHVEASLCFPMFPRFCGQMFMNGHDRDLALRCVEAYNDWMVDEWCGESEGRLLPLCLIPLWDPQLAAAEVRRNAARGVTAVTFSEAPYNLGLPSIHSVDRHWDPFVEACNETGTTICMHIGSGSLMPSTSPDAPAAVGSTLTFNNAMGSLTDWLFSGVFDRFPQLTVAYSEAQIGWIPYILERADVVWEHNRAWAGVAGQIAERPSTYFPRHVYACFFQDAFGLRNLDDIGVDNVTFETDYPHSDSTWPHTRKVAEESMAHLDQPTVDKICRDNAIRMLRLDPARYPLRGSTERSSRSRA